MKKLTIYDVRAEVLAFAILMEGRLREKDPDRGESWRSMDPDELIGDLIAHGIALDEAAEQNNAAAAIQHAVDVGNYAMFVIGVLGALTDELKRAYADARGLPDSVQEALNSGDGSYRA